MSAVTRKGKIVDVDTRVRQNVGSAGLAAGLLIFFGFFYMAKPIEGGLGGWAALVLYHTLRIGGLAMAGVAVWSSLGHPMALLVDAVTSCLIGAILVITGILMLIGGYSPLQTIILVACGTIFISAGRRNGKDFMRFPVEVRESKDAAVDNAASSLGGQPGFDEFQERADDSPDFEPAPKPSATVSGRGARFAPNEEAVQLPESEDPISLGDLENLSSEEAGKGKKPRKPNAPPPPEGYLADLADDDAPDRPGS
jgi:hypothetical protein